MDRPVSNPRRGYQRGAAVLIALALVACESAEDKAQRVDREMVQEAQRAAADESTFVADSMKFDSTFTTLAVDSTRTLNVLEPNGDGENQLVTRYLAFSTGKVCQLSKEKFGTVAPRDTIHCQWADKVDE